MNRTLSLTLLMLGCAHAKPEEMTVAEHQNEAREHEGKARDEAGKYQPGSDLRYPSRSPFSEPGGDWVVYNPTEHHLDAADTELRAAASHLAAAKKLEAFEDAACKAIPPAQRSACPLLASWVGQIKESRTGLLMVLKGSADTADVNRRLNCHLAYAVATGFDRPSCPLFMKGMTITLAQAGVIELAAADPETVKKLQQEARRLFTGP